MYLFAEQTPKKRSRTQDSGPASFFYHCIPFQPKNGGVPKIRSHQYHINSSDCHVECNYDLACPVYISDPRNHSECLSLSPMASTTAVREHVETAHRRPFYCPICGTTFATGSEADTHIQERRCAVRDILVGEIRGVPEDTMDQLSGWELQPTLSEEEQWYIMWSIMFPGIPGPATPHMSRDTATHSERRTPRAGIRG